MSNLGRARSLWFGSGWGTFRRTEPVILKPEASKDGHLRVCLSNRKRHFVHRLMLLAFAGPPPPGKPLALHQNDISSDNRLENLRWGSAKENKADALRNGRGLRPRGEASHLAKLTLVQVREIRECRAAGETYEAMAKRYGVGPQAVSKICRGLTWAEVE